jgi:hypothetical protein
LTCQRQVADNETRSMTRPVVSIVLSHIQTAMQGGLYAEVRI